VSQCRCGRCGAFVDGYLRPCAAPLPAGGETSFRLYDVGENRQDDGGKVDPRKQLTKQLDAIWLYAPPERRKIRFSFSFADIESGFNSRCSRRARHGRFRGAHSSECWFQRPAETNFSATSPARRRADFQGIRGKSPRRRDAFTSAPERTPRRSAAAPSLSLHFYCNDPTLLPCADIPGLPRRS